MAFYPERPLTRAQLRARGFASMEAYTSWDGVCVRLPLTSGGECISIRMHDIEAVDLEAHAYMPYALNIVARARTSDWPLLGASRLGVRREQRVRVTVATEDSVDVSVHIDDFIADVWLNYTRGTRAPASVLGETGGPADLYMCEPDIVVCTPCV
jgi:hypothetical protein